jgi:hypothetical protein
MATGYKTPGSGRKKGTPNKRTVDLAARLKALKCDPVGELVHLAQAADVDAAIRARCYIELLTYLYPKRKSIEITEPEQPEPADNLDLSYLTDDELETMQDILKARAAREREGLKPVEPHYRCPRGETASTFQSCAARRQASD